MSNSSNDEGSLKTRLASLHLVYLCYANHNIHLSSSCNDDDSLQTQLAITRDNSRSCGKGSGASFGQGRDDPALIFMVTNCRTGLLIYSNEYSRMQQATAH